MQPSRAGEVGWETGWVYFLPSRQSALRMCASTTSFPPQRPGDSPDGQRQIFELLPGVKIQSQGFCGEVGAEIKEGRGGGGREEKEGKNAYI